MRKCTLIFLFLFFLYFQSSAQRNNIWYFGKKAGISFNAVPGQPVPAVLSNSAMDANEGCATICDDNGDLLFYTNGITIYNRRHQVMLNGDGLMSNLSAVQSSLIIPKPGMDSTYYVFTADAYENNYANGYRYSVVDMRRAGGDGEVMLKNVLLYAPSTERMTAIRHADGVGVWVVTNDKNSNIFRSWLVDCSGLQTTPVTSTVGAVLDQYNLQGIGTMKGSPDGKLLCQTHYPFFDEVAQAPNFAQLFDFDNATGLLSNVRTISFSDAQLTSCEFSPDSKLLYLLCSNDKAISQVEATLPTQAAIIASRFRIDLGTNFFAIQAAPDGKIYLAQPGAYLGAINNPNLKGPGSNYVKEQVDILPGVGYAGLPSSINDLSFNPLTNFTYTIIDSCDGTLHFQGNSNLPGNISWDWDFGDGNHSTLPDPVHTFNPPNTEYLVTLQISSDASCGKFKIKKLVKPRGILVKAGFDFLVNCDSGYVRFTNKNPSIQGAGGYYLWDFGDGQTSLDVNPTHIYTQSGRFPVKLKFVTNKFCLSDSITKEVKVEKLLVRISPPQTILIGQKAQLSISGPGIIYSWSPSTWLSDSTIARPQAYPLHDIVYKGKITNPDGCSGEDSVKITVLDLDDVYVPSAFTPNNDGRNDNIHPFLASKFTLVEFSLFNRWGQKVFSSHSRNEGWSGKINGVEQDPGVYVWILKYSDEKQKTRVRKGTVVLMR